MARKPRDKFFHAINESYDAILSAIEAGNSRGYRVSRTLLRQSRKGERELVGLARKWVDAPTNYFDFLESILDTQARAQTRALELARDFVGGAGDSRSEAQQALTRVIQANREAGEATVETLRDAYSGTMKRIRGTDGEAEPAPARPTPVRAAPRQRAAGKVVATNRRRRPTARVAAARPAPAEEAAALPL